MATTYTGSGGTTVPGQQMNTLQDALAAITGKIQSTVEAQPENLANVIQSSETQQQMPTVAKAYASSVPQMYALLDQARQGFDQQYGAQQQVASQIGTGQVPANGLPNYPQVTAVNPAFVAQASEADVKNTMGLLTALSDYLSGGYKNIGTKTALEQQTYGKNLDFLRSLFGDVSSRIMTPQERAKLGIEAYQAGGSIDANGNFVPTDLFGMSDLGKGSTSVADLRKQYQQAYTSAPLTLKTKLSQQFKDLTGMNLYPDKLSSNEQLTVNNTNKLLTDLSIAKDIISSGSMDKYMGILGGNYSDILSNPVTASLLPDDVHRVLRILTQFKVLGERAAVGGRITGYLLDKLGPAFPDLAQGKSKVLQALNDAIDNGKMNMDTLAQQKGYSGLEEFPYYSNPEEKKTGSVSSSGAAENDPLGIR